MRRTIRANTSMRRRSGIWAAAVLAALATAACSPVAGPNSARSAPSAAAPQPVGVERPTDAPGGDTGQVDDSCNPTASLRPSGSLPAPGAMPAGSAMAKIQARGRLVVGVDQNTYLFGYRNAFTGTIEGFDIDMLREVARAIFGDPNRIQFTVITAAERISAVKDGQVDIVADTMTINCERRKDVDFSAVYYEAGQRVLVQRGTGVRSIADLVGKRVCAAKGSTSIKTIAARKAVPVAVDNWTDCMVLLQQSQIEAVSTDDTILVGMAAQDPHTEIVGTPFTSEPYGMAISRSAPEFVRFVNGVLEKARADGTWAKIHQRWLGQLGATPSPPVPRYRD